MFFTSIHVVRRHDRLLQMLYLGIVFGLQVTDLVVELAYGGGEGGREGDGQGGQATTATRQSTRRTKVIAQVAKGTSLEGNYVLP